MTTTRNETIEKIGAGLRREVGAIVQAPLPARMRELLGKLEHVEPPRKPPVPAQRCGTT
jgi:hypothetical protein